jgi:competence protein ComEC
VPVAASLWTLPLQLLHFGVVPLYAVPANLLAAPLLTPLTLGAMALALVAVLVPALLTPLLVPLGWLAQLLLQLAHAVSGLPLAQWQSGRPLPLLVLLFTVALLGLVLPGLGRRRRVLATGLGLGVLVLHLVLLGGDQLLLVHQGEGGPARDLVLARHRGRAALVSTRADGFSCRQAGQLAQGLGVARFDWALLLDPVAAADPDCWSRLAARVVAYGDGAVPLAAGQRLASLGLAVEALAMDSHALRLHLGRQPLRRLHGERAVEEPQRLRRQRRPRPAKRREVGVGHVEGPHHRRHLLPVDLRIDRPPPGRRVVDVEWPSA